MRILLILIAIALFTGCQRDLPTSAPATRRLNDAEARLARFAVADALDRIVPGLDGAAAGPLASSLTRLLGTLRDGTIDQAALAAAMRQVDGFEQTPDAHAPDLGAIRLALETVQD